MSYYIYFNPPQEEIEKFKPLCKNTGTSFNSNRIDKIKTEILCYCMMLHNNENISSIIDILEFNLRLLKGYAEEEKKHAIYDQFQEEKEIWFCGWQYSSDIEYTADDTLNNTLRTLLLYCKVVDTPDYFENNDNFFKKQNDISEEINSFIENIQECFIHEVIKKFEPYKKPEDDIDVETEAQEDTEIESDVIN